jgi:hypothetical protein
MIYHGNKFGLPGRLATALAEAEGADAATERDTVERPADTAVDVTDATVLVEATTSSFRAFMIIEAMKW